MRQAHSNDIPQPLEYLGMGEWAVRWDVQIDLNIEETDPNIKHYVYNEEIFDVKPDYGMFVTRYLRNYYTLDEENALKSNMLTAILTPEDEKSKVILTEWNEFEIQRNTAKTFGRQIFNIEYGY